MKRSLITVLFLFSNIFAVRAADPVIWTVDTRAEVVRGDARGVSISDTGDIVPAPKLAELYNTNQSYIWATAQDAAGNVYLGTGSDGKIFRVAPDGRGTMFSDLAELNVSALTIGKDNTLYAGTSPDGKVYRIGADGAASVYFEPKEKYIWSLAVFPDGSLAVGTGENGKIYRVRSANATSDASLFFDSSETHIISLAADAQGNLLAGTDGSGLVLRISNEGKAFALLDSSLREIHKIVAAVDGSIYALALADSAATASKSSPAVATGQTPEGTSVTAVITSAEAPEQAAPAKSRYDLTNVKSAVYRITPDGGNQIIWSSANVTAFSLATNQGGTGILIGTSDKGRIYSVTNEGRETLLLQTNESQISSLFPTGGGVLAASSNQGKLFRFGAESGTEGTYESSVRDAKSAALWGRVWWRSGGNVTLQTRTGNTEHPDATWSDWSAPLSDMRGAQITSPKARFMQWKAVLRSGASLSEVSVSYLAGNIAPEVLSIQVLPTNVGLAANPSVPVDPNIETSGLDPSAYGVISAQAPPRRLYQRGACSLQWTAEDRNGDHLEYDVYFKEASETEFKLLKSDLKENFYTIDGLALADGQYFFRIVARDTPSNPGSRSLSGERVTEAVKIDNTAPAVTVSGTPVVTGNSARVVFDAADSGGIIRRAEYSVNGGEWQLVYADDGISDSPRERFTVEIPVKTAGEYTVSLRAIDDNGNAGSTRIAVRR
jgi:hypothetical protein